MVERRFPIAFASTTRSIRSELDDPIVYGEDTPSYVLPTSCKCGFFAPAMSPNLVSSHSAFTCISSS